MKCPTPGDRLIVKVPNCPIRKTEVNLFAPLSNKFICPALLHVAMPYMETLEEGGWFRWMADKQCVIVLCPSVENGVVVKIRSHVDAISLTCLSVRNICPYGLKPGDFINITFEDWGICPNVFDTAFNFIGMCFSGNIKCKFCGNEIQLIS